MTIKELLAMGNEKPALCRDTVVTFVCLTMAYKPLTPTTGRKQPMKARIRWPGGAEQIVSVARLKPVTETTP